MLYRLPFPETTVRVPVPPPTVTGRQLAHRKFTPSQRAGIAAQIILGELAPVKHTAKKTYELVGANHVYTRRALQATAAERRSLVHGDCTISSLAPLAKKPSPAKKPWWALDHKDLVEAWKWCSPEERIAFVRAVGVDVVFDEAIAPIIK
jgi:hypothetical protein